MIKILAFGSFDPLHKGHLAFLRQAKALGDHLTVVVTPDITIRSTKGYTPYYSEQERMNKVSEVEYVDEVKLGSQTADPYQLLRDLEFDSITVGYDQSPSDEEIRHELDQRGKQHVKIIRLKPFHPEKYKSSFIRRS